MLRSLFPGADDFPPDNSAFPRRYLAVFIFISTVFFVFNSVDSVRFFSSSSSSSSYTSSPSSPVPSSPASFNFVFPSGKYAYYLDIEKYKLERVLRDAATKDNNTVIITTLNEAWSAPNSIIDIFLKSFKLGLHTKKLLKHLVIVCLDDKAYRRCLTIHKHCFALMSKGVDFSQEAYFMAPDYLKMMWRRIDFLRTVLEMGYNFVFTDADIMWFRDPFEHFSPDADFQIACDFFSGNPLDINNSPNGGFNYVRSNNRSIEFYKFWYSSREKYPNFHDQDVLNFIKHSPYMAEIGLKMRFLDTAQFGGFCEPSKDFNKVCTMHANCCFGMDNKLYDLKLMLQDWRSFLSMPSNSKHLRGYSWRVPKYCRQSSIHPKKTAKKIEGNGSER